MILKMLITLMFLSATIKAAIPSIVTLSEDNLCSSEGTAFDSNSGYGISGGRERWLAGIRTNSIKTIQNSTAPGTCLDYFVPYI
jgi:hypothetical protein